MFCCQCGMKNSDDDRFCTQCGQPLTPMEGGGQVQPSPPPQEPPIPATGEDPTIIAPQRGLEASPENPPIPEPVISIDPFELEPTPRIARTAPPVEQFVPEPPPKIEPPPPCITEEPPVHAGWNEEPPRQPAKPASGRGKQLGLVLCLAAVVITSGVLLILFLTGGFHSQGLLLPAILGGGALLFAVLAVVLWQMGRPKGRGVKHPLQLAVFDVTKPEQAVRVSLFNPMIIGRNEENCDLALPYERSISKQHCRLYQHGKTAFVEDLGGKNGTLLNGTPLTAATPLHSGDRLKLGRLVLQIDIEA